MKVPLSVNPLVKHGKEVLNIWFNGKNKVIPTPIFPYFYSNEKDTSIPASISEISAKKLSNYQDGKFYKYDFKTRDELVKYRELVTSFEANIPFILRNRIDNPDLFTKFPHSNELKFLFLDIEQYTKQEELFPSYEDRITSIAFCTNDRKIKSIYLKKDNTSDKKLLLKFIEIYQKISPDVLVVYNKKYDILTLLQRCQRNKINTTAFSKNNVKPYVGGKEVVNIEGVVIYDVYDSAARDQSLFGNVPNKGLKAVSNYFGFKEERKPLTPKEITEFQGTKELVEYNKDDIRRLLLLFDIYWHNIEFNANDLQIPLNTAINLNTTDLGLITIGDEYKKYNIIADGTNADRYPEIFTKHEHGGNYEGALVGISRTGLFKPMYKADYSSMYPTIMSSFNLSPDTTTLIMFEALGEFRIEENDYSFEYHIPDKVLNKNMVIQVLKEQGFCSELVKRFLKERAEYKRKWKETGEKRYRAMSDNRKVKANGGVYGIQGSAKHAFGFAPIAIATTGIGRECAQLLIDTLNELYLKSVIEYDTDGVYFSTQVFNKDDIINSFNRKLREKFKKELDLSIDIDSYDSGYFYKAKNYVLKKGEKMIYHGAAMKASSKNLLSKKLIEELAIARLSGLSTDGIVKKYQKLDFSLKYFAMNVTMGMHMSQYKSNNALAPKLARQAQKSLGIKPEIGNQYHYIKGKSDYVLYESADEKDIDTSYYLDQVNNIVEMFDVKPIMSSLKDWI